MSGNPVQLFLFSNTSNMIKQVIDLNPFYQAKDLKCEIRHKSIIIKS